MNNKILIYSDNHFCSSSSIVRGIGKKYSKRLENQIQTMKWLNDLAEQENCCGLFCLGDFFDRSDLNAEEISALSEIDFSCKPNYFVVGNHEIGRGDNSFSSTQTFLQNRNCEIFNKPAILGMGNTLIYVLPYILENDKNPVEDYFPKDVPDDKKFKLLLTHNDIKGIRMGAYVSESGFEINNLEKSFDLTVNGHIHNSEWVKNNVLNIGNITGQNFSEDALKYKHQAMIIDLDTLSYTLHENPFALNFYKLDFTNKDIDYLNDISFKLKNYVATIKVDEKSREYISYRFDPDDNNPRMKSINCPKNCNGVCCRIIVEKDTAPIIGESITSLQLDHLEEFKKFVLDNVGNDNLTIDELQEILK